MSDLSRIGIALDANLLERFDQLIGTQGYTNRSEAFRDLIRDRLVNAALEAGDTQVAGAITLIYDHHSRMLANRLLDVQHDHHDLIIATTHAHLDHHTCLEVIIVKGSSRHVRNLADRLIGTKGVQHGRLVLTAPASVLSKTA